MGPTILSMALFVMLQGSWSGADNEKNRKCKCLVTQTFLFKEN